jgi:hypothetical protein
MNQPILIETHGAVGLIRLNRPGGFNALNDAVMDALAAALDAFEADDASLVLTGSAKAFAPAPTSLPSARWTSWTPTRATSSPATGNA